MNNETTNATSTNAKATTGTKLTLERTTVRLLKVRAGVATGHFGLHLRPETSSSSGSGVHWGP